MKYTYLTALSMALITSLGLNARENIGITQGALQDCSPVEGLCQDLRLFLNEAANGDTKAAKRFNDKVKEEYQETVASDIRGRAQDIKRLAEFARKQNAQEALVELKQLEEKLEPYFEARNHKWEERRANKDL